jgi:tetratricopeptide (TPR) repeat protein
LREQGTAAPPRHTIGLDLIARLATGSASPDEVTHVLFPHLLETCPACRDLYQRLQEIKDDVGHFDEVVALLESETAPDLFQALEGLPPAEQAQAAETDESFHTWGLCTYLLRRSKEACLSDGRQATDVALLAVRIALALPPQTYHPEWVLDLQARAFAHLANALRVAGELTAADRAFADAERRCTWQSPQVKAELLSFKSSLRREQRRYGDALDAATEALEIYRTLADRRGILSCQLLTAKVHEATFDWDDACEVLRQAEIEAGLEDDPRLFAMAQANLVMYLAETGRHEEAMARLPQARELYRLHGGDTDRLRLRWTGALVLAGLGRPAEAVPELRAVQQELLDRRMPVDATLVSLDLAVALLQSGDMAALEALASEILPIFESRGLATEAVVAFTLLQFQRAVEGRSFTTRLAAELARRLKSERRPRAD